jgi:hypothetical protein
MPVLAACATSTGGGGTAGAGTGAATDSICASDPRAMAYTVGLAQPSKDKTMDAVFVDASPAPPSKGENSWTLKLTNAQGSPVDGATITATPFMPDHGHGSSVTPTVTPMGSGAYQVGNLDLFMPGIWTVTLSIKPPSGAVETVVFSFCIDG